MFYYIVANDRQMYAPECELVDDEKYTIENEWYIHIRANRS